MNDRFSTYRWLWYCFWEKCIYYGYNIRRGNEADGDALAGLLEDNMVKPGINTFYILIKTSCPR